MFFSRKVIITLSIILQLLMSNRFTFTVSYFKRNVNGRELMPVFCINTMVINALFDYVINFVPSLDMFGKVT